MKQLKELFITTLSVFTFVSAMFLWAIMLCVFITGISVTIIR